jgi:hypothetical protein
MSELARQITEAIEGTVNNPAKTRPNKVDSSLIVNYPEYPFYRNLHLVGYGVGSGTFENDSIRFIPVADERNVYFVDEGHGMWGIAKKTPYFAVRVGRNVSQEAKEAANLAATRVGQYVRVVKSSNGVEYQLYASTKTQTPSRLLSMLKKASESSTKIQKKDFDRQSKETIRRNKENLKKEADRLKKLQSLRFGDAVQVISHGLIPTMSSTYKAFMIKPDKDNAVIYTNAQSKKWRALRVRYTGLALAIEKYTPTPQQRRQMQNWLNKLENTNE